jgi:SAM-dependent methyltransferase
VSEQQEFWEAGGVYRPSTHPVVALFAQQRVAFLEALGAFDGIRTLLDVGAGSGFSSAYYPSGIRVVACDYAAGMLRGNPVRDRLLTAADHLPFASERFDAVTCWELLHHLDDPGAAVREMLRVARRRLIVFEPNRLHPGHWCLAIARENERQALRFSPGYLRRLVTAAGGTIERHVRGGLLFPNVTPLPIARLMQRLPYRLPVLGISQLVIATPAARAR